MCVRCKQSWSFAKRSVLGNFFLSVPVDGTVQILHSLKSNFSIQLFGNGFFLRNKQSKQKKKKFTQPSQFVESIFEGGKRSFVVFLFAIALKC